MSVLQRLLCTRGSTTPAMLFGGLVMTGTLVGVAGVGESAREQRQLSSVTQTGADSAGRMAARSMNNVVVFNESIMSMVAIETAVKSLAGVTQLDELVSGGICRAGCPEGGGCYACPLEKGFQAASGYIRSVDTALGPVSSVVKRGLKKAALGGLRQGDAMAALGDFQQEAAAQLPEADVALSPLEAELPIKEEELVGLGDLAALGDMVDLEAIGGLSSLNPKYDLSLGGFDASASAFGGVDLAGHGVSTDWNWGSSAPSMGFKGSGQLSGLGLGSSGASFDTGKLGIPNIGGKVSALRVGAGTSGVSANAGPVSAGNNGVNVNWRGTAEGMGVPTSAASLQEKGASVATQKGMELLASNGLLPEAFQPWSQTCSYAAKAVASVANFPAGADIFINAAAYYGQISSANIGSICPEGIELKEGCMAGDSLATPECFGRRALAVAKPAAFTRAGRIARSVTRPGKVDSGHVAKTARVLGTGASQVEFGFDSMAAGVSERAEHLWHPNWSSWRRPLRLLPGSEETLADSCAGAAIQRCDDVGELDQLIQTTM